MYVKQLYIINIILIKKKLSNKLFKKSYLININNITKKVIYKITIFFKV